MNEILEWLAALVVASFLLVVLPSLIPHKRVNPDSVRKDRYARLAHLPISVLRLARQCLPADLRSELYDNELLEEELRTILFHTYPDKPIAALAKGIRFAIGVLVGIRRSARVLRTTSATSEAKASIRVEALDDWWPWQGPHRPSGGKDISDP